KTLVHNRLHQRYRGCRAGSYLFSASIVDLELFKPANDVYGHPFGGSVLRQLAALLQSRVRQ
ncbi:diguanylate cyclase, partial [Rhodobacteraceae bacterium CH30]